MKIDEFKEQDKYCRQHNTPEGEGCINCPATNKEHCADALRNLCGRILKTEGDERNKLSKELDRLYGISPYAQLGLF